MYTKIIQVNHYVIDLLPYNSDVKTEPFNHAIYGNPQQNYHIEKNGPPIEIELVEHTDISHINIPGIQIIRKLSHGSTGSVYLVDNNNPGINRKEAIKVLKKGDVKTFEFESKLTSTLKSKSGDVVEIFGYHKVDDLYFIRMNYFENGDLVTFLKDRSVSLVKVMDMALQLTNAINNLHELGYVHRDLKPQNLFISDHHNLRVGDFGGAVEIGTEVTLNIDPFSYKNQINKIIASPAWASPEQITEGKGDIGRYSDIFAIGCCIYYMLKRNSPFPVTVKEPRAAIMEHLEKVKDISSVDFSGIHPDLVNILKNCFAYNPNDRYQDVSTLINDLTNMRKIYSLKENSPVISKIATKVTQKVLADRRDQILKALQSAGVDNVTIDFVEHSLFMEEHTIGEMVDHTIVRHRLPTINHQDQRPNQK